MEERRRENDKNWEEIKHFIAESREYRVKDELTQKFQVENIESLKNKVDFQNGRLYKVEKWKQEIENTEATKKASKESIYGLITLVSTILTAVAVVWAMFKK